MIDYFPRRVVIEEGRCDYEQAVSEGPEDRQCKEKSKDVIRMLN